MIAIRMSVPTSGVRGWDSNDRHLITRIITASFLIILLVTAASFVSHRDASQSSLAGAATVSTSVTSMPSDPPPAEVASHTDSGGLLLGLAGCLLCVLGAFAATAFARWLYRHPRTGSPASRISCILRAVVAVRMPTFSPLRNSLSVLRT